ncbi:MAG TPA: DUF1801 domain-containing protein [Panacibacter sp.]|nr:DUF1801 domain-containing protein [Panacibacter sp.]
MSISEFISTQLLQRQELLNKIHAIIIEKDKNVKASVEPMMGKEMIVYRAPGIFKYGLSGVKNYMSLHVMCIYGSAALHAKYKTLLKDANFQKGCINFTGEEQMPLDIVENLITDCSKIDLAALKEKYVKGKAKKV